MLCFEFELAAKDLSKPHYKHIYKDNCSYWNKLSEYEIKSIKNKGVNSSKIDSYDILYVLKDHKAGKQCMQFNVQDK